MDDRRIHAKDARARRAGSILGMSIMRVLISVPARLAAERFARAHLALRSLCALFSVGLGLFIVYDNGVVNRLFATLTL